MLHARFPCRPLICAALLSCACVAKAGEVVDGAYVARHGSDFQVPLTGGRWQVTDREGAGPTSVATLRLASPVVGTYPACDITRAPGMVGSIDQEALAEMVGKGMLDAGMDLGPMQMRQIGGRPVVRFNAVLNRSGGSAAGDTYVLRGRADYFIVNCSAHAAAYESAKPLFDDLVASLRY